MPSSVYCRTIIPGWYDRVECCAALVVGRGTAAPRTQAKRVTVEQRDCKQQAMMYPGGMETAQQRALPWKK